MLTVIAQACRDNERLRFSYTDREGAPTTRLVDPHRLVSLWRRWYLLAWDAEQHGWRAFRVDRLDGPAVTGARFRPREIPGGDAAEFVRSRIAAQTRQREVVVDVRADVADVEKVVAVTGGTVEAADGRTCRLRIGADDFDWPVLVLGALGAEFEVVQPPEFRDHLRATGSSSCGPPADRTCG
nr:hypothetical protein GCM10020093_076080 [Planobispora longispora]